MTGEPCVEHQIRRAPLPRPLTVSAPAHACACRASKKRDVHDLRRSVMTIASPLRTRGLPIVHAPPGEGDAGTEGEALDKDLFGEGGQTFLSRPEAQKQLTGARMVHDTLSSAILSIRDVLERTERLATEIESTEKFAAGACAALAPARAHVAPPPASRSRRRHGPGQRCRLRVAGIAQRLYVEGQVREPGRGAGAGSAGEADAVVRGRGAGGGLLRRRLHAGHQGGPKPRGRPAQGGERGRRPAVKARQRHGGLRQHISPCPRDAHCGQHATEWPTAGRCPLTAVHTAVWVHSGRRWEQRARISVTEEPCCACRPASAARCWGPERAACRRVYPGPGPAVGP